MPLLPFSPRALCAVSRSYTVKMGVVDAVLSIPPLVAVPAVLLAVVVYLVVHSKQAGLDDIPGPWLAKYTDAWRAYNAWRYYRSDMNYQRRVFKQYGDVIRIGPKTVLVSDPEAINTVFGFKTRLEKVRIQREINREAY